MRGSDARSGSLFSRVDLEGLVPAKVKVRGPPRVRFKFMFAMGAHNLIRMPR